MASEAGSLNVRISDIPRAAGRAARPIEATDGVPDSMESPAVLAAEVFETDVPARLDRLPWSRFHRSVILLLGITWVLDGLEASLIASLAPTLSDPRTLGLSGRFRF